MPDYPIVKIPQRFLRINKAVPQLPPEPVVPLEPIGPAEPESPKLLIVKDDFASSGCLGSLLAWLIGIAIAYAGTLGGGHPVVIGVGMICVLFADVTQALRQLTGNRLLQSMQTPFQANGRRCCVTSAIWCLSPSQYRFKKSRKK